MPALSSMTTRSRFWLERFTDGMISNSDIDAKLMQSTQNQMGRPHLYEQLRHHLLANVFLSRGYAGLYMGDGPMSGPLMTPQEQWTNFSEAQSQRAKATTYGVLVNDYLDQTNKTPSETEVVAMYEEGKDRDADEQSPDAGFHRRYSAKYEYLVADYQRFLDDEVAKLSEEAIRAEYERRLSGGEFQLPETPLSDMLEEAEIEIETETQDPPAANTDEAKTEASDASDAEMKEQAAEAETTDDAVSETPEEAADDKPAENTTDEKSDSEPADEAEEPAKKDSKSSDPAEEPKAEEPKTEEPKTDEPEAEATEGDSNSGNDQSRVSGSNAVRLVAFQQDDSAGDAEGAADEPKADEPKADEPKADEPKADEPKADEPKADEPKADEPKADEPKADEPKVESFEDVRLEIAEAMAAQAARQRMDAALTEAMSEMRLYFNKKSIHESNVSIGQGGEPPVKPDLKAMAAKNGLQYEAIGPYTVASISDEPIANSSEMGSQFGGRGPSFSVMMYGFDNGQTQLPRQQLFAPIRTSDAPAQKEYVSWKVDETEAYTPTLEEVRGEVVMAIRTKEARELARKAADAIAKQVTADKSLEEVIPEDKKPNLKEGLGPFSWMESFGFSGATIGNIPELDSVGEEFMSEVFNLDVDQVGVAMNQPGRVVYVVKPTSFEPSLDELRSQFKQPTNRMMAMLLGNDAGPILTEFYKSIDDKAGFTSYIDEAE